MKPARLLLLAVVALVAGCRSDAGPEPAPRAAAGCDPGIERGLRAWARAGFSGSVAIVGRGGLSCAVAYGPADKRTGRANTPATVFDIGSITKAFTAAAVLELATAGELALDDRAGDLLPGLHGPAAGVTVEQLLLHTSGLKGTHGDDHEPLTKRGAITAIGRLERAFPPGRRFLYSNAGYTLLALIVEQVSGTGYRRYLAADVLRLPGGRRAGGFWEGEPAAPGPRAVGYLEDGSAGQRGDFAGPYWAVEGNGGLAMTTADLARWTRALFTGGIVPPAAVERIATPVVRAAPGQRESPGWVAFDESVFGRPVFAAAGGGGDVGHDAIAAWLPDDGTAIAVASNLPRIRAEELLEAIGPALANGDPLPLPRTRPAAVDPARLRALAGAYALPGGGRLDVAARGRRLVVAAAGRAAVRALFPLPGAVSRAEVAAHERLVRELLAGATQEGARERAALESSFGPIARVRPGGSLLVDGELRTYVAIAVPGRSVRAWYALNAEGGVEAAQAPADPPAAALLPAGRGRFRPDDPTGAEPRVTVRFSGAAMTIAGPGGRVTARRR